MSTNKNLVVISLADLREVCSNYEAGRIAYTPLSNYDCPGISIGLTGFIATCTFIAGFAVGYGSIGL